MTKKKTAKKKKPANEDASLAKVELTEDEKARLDNYKQRLKNKPFKVKKAVAKDPGKASIVAEDNQDQLYKVKFTEAFGNPNGDVHSYLTEQIILTFSGVAGGDTDKAVNAVNNSMAMLAEIQPRDQIEALLVVQMIGTFNMSMACMGRAMQADQHPIGRQNNINMATKLTRTFVAQVEALARLRGEDKKKPRIGTVNVNDNAQAVIGDVQGGKQNAKKPE